MNPKDALVSFILRFLRLSFEIAIIEIIKITFSRCGGSPSQRSHHMLRIVWFMLKRNEVYRGEKRGLSWGKKRLERVAMGGLRA